MSQDRSAGIDWASEEHAVCDGLLIERLLDAGLSVTAVHPNQVVAMRPCYTVSGGKSDGFDSFVLAELARTDNHRFRTLTRTVIRPRPCGR